MSTKAQIRAFERVACLNKPENPEKQRQRARFEAKKNKFEVAAATGPQNNANRRNSEVLRKASLFKETSLEFEMDREAKEKEAKERKESFDRTRAEFLAKTGCFEVAATSRQRLRSQDEGGRSSQEESLDGDGDHDNDNDDDDLVESNNNTAKQRRDAFKNKAMMTFMA